MVVVIVFVVVVVVAVVVVVVVVDAAVVVVVTVELVRLLMLPAVGAVVVVVVVVVESADMFGLVNDVDGVIVMGLRVVVVCGDLYATDCGVTSCTIDDSVDSCSGGLVAASCFWYTESPDLDSVSLFNKLLDV